MSTTHILTVKSTTCTTTPFTTTNIITDVTVNLVIIAINTTEHSCGEERRNEAQRRFAFASLLTGKVEKVNHGIVSSSCGK